MKRCLAIALAVALLGCDAGSTPIDATDAASTPVDAAAPTDAGPAPDAALPPGWRVEPDVPVRIQEIAGAVHQGLLVFAGGFDGSTRVVATVRTFAPETGVWGELPELPSPVHHAVLVSAGADLYCIGGMHTLAFDPVDEAYVLHDGASA